MKVNMVIRNLENKSTENISYSKINDINFYGESVELQQYEDLNYEDVNVLIRKEITIPSKRIENIYITDIEE